VETALTSGAPALALTGIHKQYGGVHALRGAHLTLGSAGAGVVHALMGENGSGKSTMLGILSGLIRPDAGAVSFAGTVATLAGPADALRRGVAMVSQETAVVEHLSVAENVLLGRRLAGSPLRVNWRATRSRARAVLGRLNLDYDPDWIVGDLRPDQRQMVEIARALSMDASILVLDEPTSHFADDEVASLFAVIRSLKERGISTIFVSHRLKEIFAIADEVTVLRDGETVATGPITEFTPETLVGAMVGEAAGLRGKPADRAAPASQRERPLLSVQGLHTTSALRGIDLTVSPGEIVGVAGLLGSGCSDLLRAVFGLEDVTAGEIRLGGELLRPGDTRGAILRGIGYVPPDRRAEGAIASMSVNDNLMMVHTMRRLRLAHPSHAAESRTAAQVMQQVRIRAASAKIPVGSLSGGNQQKVVLGKWLVSDPALLLLDEPTRGVDVAAKSEIHQLLRLAAQRGVGLLVSSSENDELLELCDRIAVMFRGRIVASCTAREADEAMLARYAGGHT
jgi:ribose transport system ATP-binding protein/rhamnose transport system ATP-binding protein